jgi:hypothetical protein
VEPEAARILSRVRWGAGQSDEYPDVLMGFALWTARQGAAIIASAVCAVAGVAWTLTYFRPTIERFLRDGGGNMPAERLQVEARRWIRLNWVRVGLVAISWWGALSTLAGHG